MAKSLVERGEGKPLPVMVYHCGKREKNKRKFS